MHEKNKRDSSSEKSSKSSKDSTTESTSDESYSSSESSNFSNGEKEIGNGVIYNVTFFGILFNFFVGLVRFLVYFPSLYYIMCTFSYLIISLPSSNQITFDIFMASYQLTVLFVVMFDCLTANGSIFGFGSFYERAIMPRISYWAGLGGHVGLTTFRLMLWSVIIISQKYDRYNFSFYKDLQSSISVDNAENIYDIGIYLINIKNIYLAIIIYICLAILSYFSSLCFKSWLEHPWTSSYINDPPAIYKNVNFPSYSVGMLIINTIFFVYSLIDVMNYDNFFPEQWDWSDEDYIIYFSIGIIMTVCIFRHLYLLYLYSKSRAVYSTFVFIFWYFCYLVFLVENNIKAKEGIKYVEANVYFTISILILNILILIIMHPIAFINHVLYIFKIAISFKFLNAVLVFLIINCVIFSGILAYAYKNADWFDTELKFPPFINEIIEIANALYTTIEYVFSAILSIVSIIGEGLATFLCIILTIAMATTLILMALPFSFATGSWAAKNITEMSKSLQKIVKKIKGFKKPLKKLKKFTEKLIKFTSLFTAIGVIAITFGFFSFIVFAVPMFLTASGIAVGFFDRKAEFIRCSYVTFFIFSISIVLMTGGMLMLLKYILARTFNFIIFTLEFIPTSAFYSNIYAHILAILSLCYFFLLTLFCTNKKANLGNKNLKNICIKCRTRKMCKSCKNLKNYKKINQEKLSCDLDPKHEHQLLKKNHVEVDTSNPDNSFIINGQVVFFTSLLGDLLRKIREIITCRKNKRKETFSYLCRECLRKTFCCPSEDNRHLCPYDCEFPCCHFDDEEDCFRRNKPLNCFCCEIECDCAEPTMVSSFFTLGDLNKLVIYFLPIVLCVIAILMFLNSLSLDWMEFLTETDAEIQKMMGDQTSDASLVSITSMDDENSNLCPFIDVSAIVDLLLSAVGGIFGFLGQLLSPFKILHDAFLSMQTIFNNIESIKDVFDLIFKLVLTVPGFSGAGLIIMMCFFAVFDQFIGNLQIVFISISYVMMGSMAMISFPIIINGILAIIPFLDFTMVLHSGYYRALYAYVILFLSQVVLTVDGISKPVAPLKPLDLNDMMAQENEEVDDPLHLNKYINISADAIARSFGIKTIDDDMRFDI